MLLKEIDVSIVLYMGTLIMALVAIFVVFLITIYQKRLVQQRLSINRMQLKKKQEIISSNLETQEQERQAIAKNLHDDVGASLSALKLSVKYIEKIAEKPELTDNFANILRLLDDSINKVRSISRNLSPTILTKRDLSYAIKDAVNYISLNTSIRINFECNDYKKINAEIEIQVFRVFQEILSNAIRHSNTDNLEVLLIQQDRQLELVISDSGKGFELKEDNVGLGLANVESRCELIGATCNWVTAIGKGTEFKLILKYEEQN